MRKVIYSEYVRRTEEKDGKVIKSYFELEPKGEAKFHQFGVDFEEFEHSAGNFSTAIIELADGTVKNIPVENIKFINENQS